MELSEVLTLRALPPGAGALLALSSSDLPPL